MPSIGITREKTQSPAFIYSTNLFIRECVVIRGHSRIDRGTEPLRTLAGYRLEEQKVWFGMNLIHDGTGVLRVGDAVVTA